MAASPTRPWPAVGARRGEAPWGAVRPAGRPRRGAPRPGRWWRGCLLVVGAGVGGAGAACTGPVTHVDNPAGDRVFVDGHLLRPPPPPAPGGAVVPEPEPQVPGRTTLKFRYYGTTRLDAQPADLPAAAPGAPAEPDWNRRPASARVELPAPVAPWLFPFDFPLELAHRLLAGRPDATAAVALPTTPPEQQVQPGIPQPGLDELLQRAHAARTRR